MNGTRLLTVGMMSWLVAVSAHAAPVVQITKSCPGLRYLGRNATFQITVTNSGDSQADNVVVTDMIPAGIDFISADNNGSHQGNRIVWNVGTLEAGKSKDLSCKFRCNRIGTYKNAATVSYCARAEAQCELQVKGIPAILLECVDDPDPIEINSNVTYTISVTNQGTAVGTNVAIACTLPPELQYVSDTGPTASTRDGQSVTFAPVATLAPKKKAVYKLTVKGVGEGDVRFRVQMTSDQIGSPVMETESTHVYK